MDRFNLVQKVFGEDLKKIQNEQLRNIVTDFMAEQVPDYFWKIGASSSGRYHPEFAQGNGGLVRHTLSVLMFLHELMQMSSYSYMKQDYKDYAIASAIMHDTFKYGDLGYDDPKSKKEYKYHARRASDEFEKFCIVRDFYPSEFLLNAMTAHMGQWTEESSEKPFTSIDRLVHLADYVASRNFFDIPSLSRFYSGEEEI